MTTAQNSTAYIREICRKFAKNNALADINVFDIEDDGYDETLLTDSLAYLYRVIFSTNIAALNAENRIRINENVGEPYKALWYDKIITGYDGALKDKAFIKDYFIRLKIALLTQGVVKDEKFCEYLDLNNKSVRPATNNAIDIKIDLPNGIAGESVKGSESFRRSRLREKMIKTIFTITERNSRK